MHNNYLRIGDHRTRPPGSRSPTLRQHGTCTHLPQPVRFRSCRVEGLRRTFRGPEDRRHTAQKDAAPITALGGEGGGSEDRYRRPRLEFEQAPSTSVGRAEGAVYAEMCPCDEAAAGAGPCLCTSAITSTSSIRWMSSPDHGSLSSAVEVTVPRWTAGGGGRRCSTWLAYQYVVAVAGHAAVRPAAAVACRF